MVNWDNPKEIREYNKKYYQKNKDNPKYKLTKKKWKEKNPNYYKEYNKKWRTEHPNYQKEYGKKYYQEHKEKYDLKNRGWIKRHPKRKKELQRVGQRKYKKRHPEKIEAHRKANKIKIPKGQLCQICSVKLAVERHHEDYSKPLEVLFVCNKCHNTIHRGN